MGPSPAGAVGRRLRGPGPLRRGATAKGGGRAAGRANGAGDQAGEDPDRQPAPAGNHAGLPGVPLPLRAGSPRATPALAGEGPGAEIRGPREAGDPGVDGPARVLLTPGRPDQTAESTTPRWGQLLPPGVLPPRAADDQPLRAGTTVPPAAAAQSATVSRPSRADDLSAPRRPEAELPVGSCGAATPLVTVSGESRRRESCTSGSRRGERDAREGIRILRHPGKPGKLLGRSQPSPPAPLLYRESPVRMRPARKLAEKCAVAPLYRLAARPRGTMARLLVEPAGNYPAA